MDFLSLFKKYRCDICGRRFRRIEHSMHHQLLFHSNNYSYDCSNCGGRFSDMDKLKDHIRMNHSYKK
jgi:DNA-directed RNA polymerase subunit RPC12/RpoP